MTVGTKTFILCKLTPGKEQAAVKTIRALEGVTEVYMVFGGWDMTKQDKSAPVAPDSPHIRLL